MLPTRLEKLSIAPSIHTAGPLLALAFLIPGTGTARAEPPQVELESGWVLKTGDDLNWAEPGLDDSEWRAVRVGQPWEEAGFPDYDGYAWYRTRCVIPATWREHPDAKELGSVLMLTLGPIDDVDVTYFNGIEIGRTGTMPPDYATAYAYDRTYRVPFDAVRWGQTNVVAVRVYDGAEPGGIYKGPVIVRMPERTDFLDMGLRPVSSNGICRAGDSLAVSCAITNLLAKPATVRLTATLWSDRVAETSALDRIQREMDLDAATNVTHALTFRSVEPGFYRVNCLLAAGASSTSAASLVVGYAPRQIRTALTRETDFEVFWRERRQDLAKVEPAFRLTPSDLSTEKMAVYLVEMRSYGDVLIRGWYSVPRTRGPHPAILRVPGYTSTMEPVLDRPELAYLALNPRGHGNSKDDLDPGDGEYMFIGFEPDHPERYVYAGAYLDCIRAIDFLVSRPEVDASRIGVEGGSQGGGLTFATAALDPRVTCCAPDIPWLGDWVGYLQCAAWPHEEYPTLQEAFPGLTFAGINRLLSYFDTMNLADRIRCPVLMSIGLQDDVCPPRNGFNTYNRVESEKSYRVYPSAGHWVPDEHYELKRRWMNEHLGVGR